MPDQSDVEAALVALVDAAIYPTGERDLAGSAIGVNVRVYRNEPNPAELDADLLAGVVNVSVSAEKDMSADRTRFAEDWQTIVPPVTTISVTTAGNVATFAGAPGVRQLAGVRLGGPGSAAYSVALPDTAGPDDAAAALAAVVPGAVAAGATLTVPGALRLCGRTAGFGTIQREMVRQEDVFRVILWCPTSALRDAVAIAVKAAVSATDWLDLPDACAGRIRYRGTSSTDGTTKAGDWRRDLLFSVEYADVQTVVAPAVIWGQAVHSTPRGDTVSVVA